MNRAVESPHFSALTKPFAIALIIPAAVAIGPLVQILHVGIREIVIVVLVLLMAALIIVPSERILRFSFTLWILTFAFGWRTIYLTPSFNIHPSEVLVMLLFFAVFAFSIVKRSNLDFSLPLALPIFLLFMFLGVFTALENGRRFDVVIQEFKAFFAAVPSYYVVKWMIRTREDWERAARWSIVVAVYIGCLGLMDYFVPSVSLALSGLGAGPTIAVAQSYSGASFARVGFIFFGNFTAGFVIFTFVGFTVYHLLERRAELSSVQKILLTAILLIQVSGIYLSGYRGLWYAVGFFLIIYALLRRQAIVLLAATLLGVSFLPTDFITRFQSVFNTEYADSSQYDRIARANYALDLLQRSPLTGVGWGGSGYVHSDLIQIAANLGVIAFFIFMLWILGILYRLWKITRSSSWANGYATVLFPMVCALVVVFSGEGLALFVQLIMPIWFLFSMAHRLSDLSRMQNSEQR